MLIEQAFHNLPEILCGSGYPTQEYESGLVVALTLAILQELNGRNANNPLSFIQAEKQYRVNGVYKFVDAPRFLRADLHVDIRNLYIANKRLRQYGWRYNNWLEAKFFRNQTDNGERHSSNKTNHVAGIIGDLLRLSILVYEAFPGMSSSSRYFLHVYDSDPKFYLPYRNRTWLKKLTLPGFQQVNIENLQSEVLTVRRVLGEVSDLNVTLRVFNQIIEPLTHEYSPMYYLILSRLDKIRVSLNQFWFEISPDSSTIESEQGAYDQIVCYLASNIHLLATDQTRIDENIEDAIDIPEEPPLNLDEFNEQ